MDPHEFGIENPFPTLAVKDKRFDAQGSGYRGSVYPPFNYMVIKGLEKYKRHDLAREFAIRHLYHVLDGLYTSNGKKGSLYEAYAPHTEGPAKWPGKKGFPRTMFVPYTALTTVSLMLENIIGLNISLPRKTVDWTIPTLEAMGIGDLALKRNLISILSAKSSRGWEVHLESEKLYYLTIDLFGARSKTLPIPSGKCSHPGGQAVARDRGVRVPTGTAASADTEPTSFTRNASALEGAGKGLLVGKLQVPSHGKPEGDARHLHLRVLQRLERYSAVVSPSTVGFVARITSRTPPFVNPLQESGDAQVLRPNTVDGRDGAHEHVVQPAVLVDGFDGQDVSRLFHDADGGGVPLRIGADAARVDDRCRFRTRCNCGWSGEAARGPPQGSRDESLVGAQEVVGDAGGALLAQAGQPGEVSDQPLQCIHA